MPLVICPGCQTTLDVPEGTPDQPVACPLCATVFLPPPTSSPPLAIPIGPTLPQLPPTALATAADDADAASFALSEAAHDSLQQLRLDTTLKETADGLFLASVLNIVAAFGTAIAVGLVSSTSVIAALSGYTCLLLWVGGLAFILVGAARLKQRRRPDLVRAAAVGAILVGLVVIGLSGISFAIIVLFQGRISPFGIFFYLMVELLSVATSVFTIHAGVRTLRTLRRPDIAAALGFVPKPSRKVPPPVPDATLFVNDPGGSPALAPLPDPPAPLPPR
jgi:LSD1 subclass zinc finger protein